MHRILLPISVLIITIGLTNPLLLAQRMNPVSDVGWPCELNTCEIQYKLTGKEDETFTISLYLASISDSSNRINIENNVEGDIGKNVVPGMKIIRWERDPQMYLSLGVKVGEGESIEDKIIFIVEAVSEASDKIIDATKESKISTLDDVAIPAYTPSRSRIYIGPCFYSNWAIPAMLGADIKIGEAISIGLRGAFTPFKYKAKYNEKTIEKSAKLEESSVNIGYYVPISENIYLLSFHAGMGVVWKHFTPGETIAKSQDDNYRYLATEMRAIASFTNLTTFIGLRHMVLIDKPYIIGILVGAGINL